MTTLQIIDQIKMITPQEREQISLFLAQCDITPSSKLKKSIDRSFTYADNSIVEKASEQILNKHASLMEKLAL